ncbi:hypothetical protein NECAME_06646 [Necator americanus]|uniref:Uncharacterized protein n=1 Tax=Necator americanus TaxID=51031 RepID=W2TUY2_NECAM|nr:hypothetical protein NECAME_06646 [Necator americanus]ETN84842.1 hypothetical protein NECAME_06646 [Necator americanus]
MVVAAARRSLSAGGRKNEKLCNFDLGKRSLLLADPHGMFANAVECMGVRVWAARGGKASATWAAVINN